MTTTVAPTTSFEQWLQQLPVQDGIASISNVRRYQHDEAGYDAQYANDTGNIQVGRGVAALVKRLEADTSGPAIEIGCGTGLVTLGLAANLPHPLYLVTDPSPVFLRITEKKLAAGGVRNSRVRYGVLLGEELNRLPAEEASLIVLRSTLHHVIDIEQFIAQAARALRPGGILMCQEPCYEGYLLMGAMAQFMPMACAAAGQPLSPEHQKHVKLFCDTMKFYARRDLDKSKAEDKHLFRVDELMRMSDKNNMSMEFFPNLTFESFDPQNTENAKPDRFAPFFKMYLRYCMSFPVELVEILDRVFAPYIKYVEDSTAGSSGPYLHGVFIARKR